MRYNDKSKEQLKNMAYISLADFALKDEGYWRFDFETLVGLTSIKGDLRSVVKDMVNHFMSGTGTPYRYKTLTKKVREHESVKKYVSEIKKAVKKLLKKYEGDSSKLKYKCGADRDYSLMVKAMRDNSILEPSFGKILDHINGLGITIHSFEGNSIELTSAKKNGSTYSGTLHFKLWDDFGLDEEDVSDQGYYAGLRSWYILQHYKALKGRHKPFQTIIEFDEKF